MRIARVLHSGLNVRKVKIDKAVYCDKLGNGLNARFKYIIRHSEAFLHSKGLVAGGDKSLIGDHHKGIHVFHKLAYAALRLHHFGFLLKIKRLRYNGNGKNIHFLGYLGNDGSRACTRTSAHTRGNKHHGRALESGSDLVPVLLSGTLAYFRLVACAASSRKLFADLHLCGSFGGTQCGGVGIHGDELNVENTLRSHAVKRVSAASADAHDFYINIGKDFLVIDRKSHLQCPPNLNSIKSRILRRQTVKRRPPFVPQYLKYRQAAERDTFQIYNIYFNIL